TGEGRYLGRAWVPAFPTERPKSLQHPGTKCLSHTISSASALTPKAQSGSWSRERFQARPNDASGRGDDRAQHDAALLGVVIAGAAVHRRALVPHQQVADLPGMVVGETLLRRMRGEVLDQPPGHLAVHPLEAVCVHRVDKEDRAAADRMLDD